MDGSSFLPLCAGLRIEHVTETPTGLVVSVLSLSAQACCPLCEQTSERKHSRYIRCITDLPCTGRQVTLLLSLCKYFCQNPACLRTIFTERLPDLVQSSARLTNRLRETLVALGFATCGEVTSRLAPQLGMQTAPTTIIRRLRAVQIEPPPTVKRLGVDDWAWKKGQTYGTILVDLDLHRPIELLPDRSEQSLEVWLRAHPEIDTVSRDRAGAYAKAASKGAPQAQQVADRFHILKNLRERLKDFMDTKQSCLPEREEETSDAIPAKAQGIKVLREQPQLEEPEDLEQEKHYRAMSPYPRERPAGMSYDAFHKQVRRDNRYARYDAVRTLYLQGFNKSEISRQLGLCRETITKYIEAEVFPEITPPPKKASILDPYKPYLLQRWQQRCCNGAQLYEEIKARGYTGSQPLLAIFLADLRKKHQEAGDPSVLTLDDAQMAVTLPSPLPPKPKVTHHMSSTRASWLFFKRPEKLEEKQRQQVEQIRGSHPELDTAYLLCQGFVTMLAEPRDQDLDTWLNQAEQSNIPEFQGFANGIRRDYDAVKAAFSSEISNGQVEGQVHRLKLQKRQVYGRANFDLLRLRVLHRA